MGQGTSSSSSTSLAGSGGGAPAGLATVPVGSLAAGDIVLIRQQVHTAYGAMDSGVLRAVAASQRSNYVSAQQTNLGGELPGGRAGPWRGHHHTPPTLPLPLVLRLPQDGPTVASS